MTRTRHSQRGARTWIGLGWILIGTISLTGAGRREPAPTTGVSSPVRAPSASITPGIAHADVDTLDLQLD
jgi:hypothetical protein